jgi:peptide deformylase
VKVRRHSEITVSYTSAQGLPQTVSYHNDRAELFQHEYDHLEGIRCTQRAIDDKAFRWRW